MKLLKTITLTSLLVFAQNSHAATNVETLLKNDCSSCHGDEMYTRPDRRVNNLMQLEKQLHRCNHAIGSQWDINTVTDVMNYLNKSYYKFKE